MVYIKKIFAVLLSLTVLAGAALLAGAAGADELSITAKNKNANEVEITLTNTSEYYLGNVKIKVSPVSGSGAKVTSFGIGGASGDDSVYSVAPGEGLSVTAKVGTTNNTRPETTSVTATTNKKPTITTADKIDSPIAPADGTVASTDLEGTDTASDTSVSDNESVESGTDDGAASSEETTVGTVHSIAPGESATVVADVSENADDSDDDDNDGSPATVWIICGVAAVLVAAGVVVFIFIRKKKNAVKDISTLLVFALLLGVLASVNGNVLRADAADDIVSPTEDSVTYDLRLSDGRGTIRLTAEYIIAPKAETQALKNKRRAPSGDDCNTPKVDQRRIREGAGPLTEFGIYVGKNDMMFFGDAIKDYKGQTLMNDVRLERLANTMNQRDSWAKENGIKLYMVIAPNKTSVYPDYIPDTVHGAAKTNADSVVEYLAKNSTVEVIDLRGAVKNARSEYGDDLFYNYDTHWNNHGGFVGYSEVMRHISQDFPGVYTHTKNDYTIAELETYMKDMAWYLGFYSSYSDYGPLYTLKSGMTATLTGKGDYDWHGQFLYGYKWSDGYADSLKYVEYENKFNTDAPSLYMYRDSFSVAMLHFFKDSFHKSAFDWSYEFSKSEILESGADVVIMEVVEKQLTEFTNTRPFTN